VTLETAPSALWDASVLPSGDDALGAIGQALEFIKDQYRHCKPILAMGSRSAVLTAAGIPTSLPDGCADPGLVMGDDPRAFTAALALHRVFERETDPPRV